MPEKLVEVLSSNDLESAVRIIYGQYEIRLRSYFRTCLHDHADIDDAIINTVMVVFKKNPFAAKVGAASWEASCKGFELFLFGIAKNICNEFNRRRQRWKKIQELVPRRVPTEVLSKEENENWLEVVDHLVQCIMNLDDVNQEIIFAKYYDGLKILVIAKRFNLTEAAICMRLKRAKEAIAKCLRSWLKQNGFDEKAWPWNG